MTLHVNLDQIVWAEFGELEPPQPEWSEQFDYWEDYVRKFFRSNGLEFNSDDSNVQQWLMGEERAPFAAMVQQLLPRLAKRADLDITDAILFAHWLPDLHMGTSVTNFMMHELGLSDCFGFAISDRGLSAPFFAFDSLYKYLQAGRRKGLLAIADQKHLLYKSDLVSRLNPKNSACIIRVDVENKQGFRYAGYARCALQKGTDGNGTVAQMLKELGLDQRSTTLIGPRSLLDDIRLPVGSLLPTQDELVCSAPFAAFSAVQNDGCNYLLLCQDEKHVTALGFAGRAS